MSMKEKEIKEIFRQQETEERVEQTLYDNKSILTTNTSKSTEMTNSFNNFINNNKQYFTKLGIEEFLNDPIFKLKDDEEAKPEDWDDVTNTPKTSLRISCTLCNESGGSSLFQFKKNSYCKFCGSTVCYKCVNKANTKNGKLICGTCEKKFKVYYAQIKFKDQFESIEHQIKEASQNAESIGLKLSESSHEIEMTKQKIEDEKRQFKHEIERLQIEQDSLKKNQDDCDNDCITISNKINTLIEEFKKIDKEYVEADGEYKKILQERENMYKEFISKQDKLNRLNKENQELSLNMQNYDAQINKRIVIDFTKDAEVIFLEPVRYEEENKQLKGSTVSSYSTRSSISNFFRRIGSSLMNK